MSPEGEKDQERTPMIEKLSIPCDYCGGIFWIIPTEEGNTPVRGKDTPEKCPNSSDEIHHLFLATL